MSKPLVILGAGGHAAVLVDILRQQERMILAVQAPEMAPSRRVFSGLAHWPDEQPLLALAPDEVELVNGIGSLPGMSLRYQIYARYRALGFAFAQVIAAEAVVSRYAQLGDGVQILQRALVQSGASIGANSIINSGAIIEHDCQLGVDNHIAPGAVLSGGVHTGARVHVGTGAAVIQGRMIGDEAVVAAGASLNRDLAAAHIAYAARSHICTIKKQ